MEVLYAGSGSKAANEASVSVVRSRVRNRSRKSGLPGMSYKR